MLLQRYLGDYANATLREGRLKLAKPSSLNDPFEFAFRPGGEMTLAEAIKHLNLRLKDPKFRKRLSDENPEIVDAKTLRAYIRANKVEMAQAVVANYYESTVFSEGYLLEAADTTFSICCFSENDIDPFDEILLWSHYGNKHSGTRILFDTVMLIEPHLGRRSLSLRRVTYHPQRVELDLTRGEQTPDLNAQIIASLRTKAPSWAYENEFRLLAMNEHCQSGTDGTGLPATFLAFPPIAVRRVDFGLNCPAHIIDEILTTVGELYPHIACRKGTRHPTEFRVIYDSIR